MHGEIVDPVVSTIGCTDVWIDKILMTNHSMSSPCKLARLLFVELRVACC